MERETPGVGQFRFIPAEDGGFKFELVGIPKEDSAPVADVRPQEPPRSVFLEIMWNPGEFGQR